MFVNRTSKRGFSQIKREEYREESVRKHTQFSPKTEQFGACFKTYTQKNPSITIVKTFIISGLWFGAVDEARTRDPQLGKLMLYQLSYYRKCW